MKNSFFAKITAIALLLFIFAATAATAADMQIIVNGKKLNGDVAPAVIENRTMLPLRACAEALDATVNYDAATGIIDIFSGANRINLMLNSSRAIINGTLKNMDIEPQIINNRTLVPLRFIGEALNAQVNWLPESSTITIVSNADTNAGSNISQPTLPVDPDSLPNAETVAKQALQQINSVRLQKSLNSFVTAEELVAMAAEHSRDMAEKDYFSNTTPGGSTPAARATAGKLPVPDELIAKIDYSRENVYQAVTEWLNKQPARAVLLNPSAAYIGISAFYKENSAELYLTAEVMPYRAYFTDLPQSSTVNSDKLTVRGRSQNLQEAVTVYKIAADNPQMYTSKKTYFANGDGTYFHTVIEFDTPGLYALQMGGCIVRVNYVPAAQ